MTRVPSSKDGKNKFNKAWLNDHLTDPYVRLAREKGYRSRAAFKLIEILDHDKLLRQGMVVVDLGAAPGSWTQVVRERLRRPGGGIDGFVVALDLLPMEPVADVHFIQGDFREDEVLRRLEAVIEGRRVDLVISDMAPNLSGIELADAARMAHVCELALDFALAHLRADGALVMKVFHGGGYSELVMQLKARFKQVAARKPKASRDRSAETYLVAKGLK